MMIRLVPDPILRLRSKEVSHFTPEFIQSLVDELVELTNATIAVGFSAPQIGISLRVIVYQDMDGAIKELINPQIEDVSDKIEVDVEGCMSIPHFTTPIARPHAIKLRADNLSYLADFYGLPARVIQHEIDHLDGILITDKIYRGEK